MVHSQNTAQHLIVGASARAAAFSAIRGGFNVQCADLFADFDLKKQAPTSKIETYPGDIPKIIAESSADYWLYTGAIENYADLVEEAATTKPLLGNNADVLRLVRDPFWLKETFGDDFPEVSQTRPKTDAGDWLYKPFRSAGGANIRFADELPADFSGDGYFQRYVLGDIKSGVFIAARGNAVLLDVTETWLGENGADGAFGYANWQTTGMGRSWWRDIEEVGQRLAAAVPIVGIFGIDFVGTYVVEVNPRYTASCEVLERIYDESFIDLHVQACLYGELPDVSNWKSEHDCSKSIFFADRDIVVPKRFTNWAMSQNTDKLNPRIADIPHPGEKIARGRPVCTLLGQCSRQDHFEWLSSGLHNEVDRRLVE